MSKEGFSGLEVDMEYDVCKNPGQLLNSDTFRRFMAHFNRVNKLGKPGWVDLEPADVAKDAFIAEQVFKMWEEFQVSLSGRGRDVRTLQYVIDETLGQIKRVATLEDSRVLEPDQMEQRFGVLGYDIEELRQEHERLYKVNGFGRALAATGHLSRPDDYNLPMPQISHGHMRAIEAAIEEDRSGQKVTIEDDRLSSEALFELLERGGNIKYVPGFKDRHDVILAFQRPVFYPDIDLPKNLTNMSRVSNAFSSARQAAAPRKPVRFCAMPKVLRVADNDKGKSLAHFVQDWRPTMDLNTFLRRFLESPGRVFNQLGRAQVFLNAAMESGFVVRATTVPNEERGLKLGFIHPGENSHAGGAIEVQDGHYIPFGKVIPMDGDSA